MLRLGALRSGADLAVGACIIAVDGILYASWRECLGLLRTLLHGVSELE
jgi:hypothetical protein